MPATGERGRYAASSPASPLATIALPVLDAEPWLDECLDSIAAQTEPRFELVAVDDGSTDRSRSILEARAERDPRVRILETRDGERGIAAALNVALDAARARVLVRMDADDRMHAGRVARQRLDRHRRMRHPCRHLRVERLPLLQSRQLPEPEPREEARDDDAKGEKDDRACAHPE